MEISRVARALVSAYDKSGLIPFAKQLENNGVEIVSTGGTLKYLQENGLSPVAVEDVTGFPEILQGRVKTLHPRVHAGILAKSGSETELAQLNIDLFDLVVVNLYPFTEIIQNKQADLNEVMENIDIGGPTMVRAAAKNWERVGICVSPKDYNTIVEHLQSQEGLGKELRKQLAAKAFQHTAEYDAAISEFFQNLVFDSKDDKHCQNNEVPECLSQFVEKQQLNYKPLSYGENPHQKAGFIQHTDTDLKQHQGKELSYNNINDLDAAISLAHEFDYPAVAAVKHTNPCGLGIADTISEAYQKAYESDPVSIFGGIVASNKTVTKGMAEKLTKIFLDVVAAPDYSPEALETLAVKPGTKVVSIDLGNKIKAGSDNFKELVSTSLGYLYQEKDEYHPEYNKWKKVSGEEASSDKLQDLITGEKVVKYVKSNAIALVKQNQLIGVGAGQMNRVAACKTALEQAGDSAQGSILASDAFFPFDDVVQLAAEYGVSCIVQPGGSKRDPDSIEAAERAGITMYFTGIRHFKH